MEEKSIRAVSFAGDHSKWREWKLKFLSKALYSGYRDVLLGKETVPKDSEIIDTSTDAGKKLESARTANRMAYAALALSCEEAALGLVEEAVSADLPDGDAALVWKNLTSKYEPATNMSHVQLRKEFTQCRLKSVKDDPDKWVRELEHLKSQIEIAGKEKMSDNSLMAHILASLPEEYSELVTSVEGQLNTNKLTIGDLRERLRSYFEREFKGEGNETALLAFKGTCRSCGKIGHKVANCLDRGNGNKNNSIIC